MNWSSPANSDTAPRPCASVFGDDSDDPPTRPYRIAGFPLKFPGAWPVARIRLRYRQRPKLAERFVPRAEEKAGAGRVGMPEDDGAEWPGEAKEVIEQAPEAEAEVDLWEAEPLAEDTEIMRTDPNAERLEAADEPPGATANRADMRGRNSPDGAKPEGGMIRI